MPQRRARPVPFHSLGISQIIAYGLLFYVFAQLKTPLAVAAGVEETAILAAITGALVLQSLIAPIVGGWVDRHGAFPVMAIGLAIGSLGLFMLPKVEAIEWIWACMIPIGVAFSMSTYEVAFGAAVQMDESRARRNITFITFYGGVASSITWLSVAPMLAFFGLETTCSVTALIMLLMSGRFLLLSRNAPVDRGRRERPAAFSWSSLTGIQKRAMVTLGMSSTLEYIVFAGTTLLWINWFTIQFGPTLAVVLAAVYGPFQVVGRMLEMLAAKRFDARWTAMAAFLLAALAIVLARSDHLPVAVISMVLFGMGHGILTVTFGYVTNMYFRAEVYGRAKGWISAPRGFGSALGPSIGGALFVAGTDIFFASMFALMLACAIVFSTLLRLKPGNLVRQRAR